MDGLNFLIITLFIGSALFPVCSHSQTPAPPPNFIETLNKEAGATDTAGSATIARYSGSGCSDGFFGLLLTSR